MDRVLEPDLEKRQDFLVKSSLGDKFDHVGYEFNRGHSYAPSIIFGKLFYLGNQKIVYSFFLPEFRDGQHERIGFRINHTIIHTILFVNE